MNEEQLAAFYAESARRWEIAKREFQQREHGWPFGLAPEAEQWADSFSGRSGLPETPAAWVTGLVRQADADGVITKPEPGVVRSAYAHRDSWTEMDSAVGFGFQPDAAEVLVVHAGHAVMFEDIAPAIGGDGAAALAVLRAVVESFSVVRPFAEPPE
ncbi:MAG: hypothetical protein HOW97_42395 [Catenulispora sp.]|nr:hypothetical protein [Catenulispora sp.]